MGGPSLFKRDMDSLFLPALSVAKQPYLVRFGPLGHFFGPLAHFWTSKANRLSLGIATKNNRCPVWPIFFFIIYIYIYINKYTLDPGKWPKEVKYPSNDSRR